MVGFGSFFIYVKRFLRDPNVSHRVESSQTFYWIPNANAAQAFFVLEFFGRNRSLEEVGNWGTHTPFARQIQLQFWPSQDLHCVFVSSLCHRPHLVFWTQWSQGGPPARNAAQATLGKDYWCSFSQKDAMYMALWLPLQIIHHTDINPILHQRKEVWNSKVAGLRSLS